MDQEQIRERDIAEFENLPKELKELHDLLYGKIKAMVAGQFIDGKGDLLFIKHLIEVSMEVVEKFRDANGQPWTGLEKRSHALALIKYVITNLQADGKIQDEFADNLLMGLDLFGGVIMDVAVDAIHKVFDIGQDIQENGCRGCFTRNF